MMPQKLLHQLLTQDQEPFLLDQFSPQSHFPSHKRKPISHSASFCKGACFLTPSPLFQFHSPAKNPHAVFLHVPAATAELLLDAALRIQKQSTAARTKSNGFGLLGSFLKRFTHRRRSRKQESDGDCRRNDLHGGPPPPLKMAVNENENENDNNSDFCDSPFRFALQSSPSAGHRTPEFSSPARHDHQVNDVESLAKLPVVDEEEEKEQNSPVSVFDPPFEDDEEGHNEDQDENDYDMECSYANVQKAKHQLLKKLRRFERLAELDPVELEAFLLKDEEDELEDDNAIDLSNNEKDGSSYEISHLPEKDTKRLVCNLDLVVTDKRDEMKKKVYMRSDLWKRVDSSAIDVMVGQDLKAELEGWNKNREQRGEIGIDIEVEIFSLLVEEMQTDLQLIN